MPFIHVTCYVFLLFSSQQSMLNHPNLSIRLPIVYNTIITKIFSCTHLYVAGIHLRLTIESPYERLFYFPKTQQNDSGQGSSPESQVQPHLLLSQHPPPQKNLLLTSF